MTVGGECRVGNVGWGLRSGGCGAGFEGGGDCGVGFEGGGDCGWGLWGGI